MNYMLVFLVERRVVKRLWDQQVLRQEPVAEMWFARRSWALLKDWQCILPAGRWKLGGFWDQQVLCQEHFGKCGYEIASMWHEPIHLPRKHHFVAVLLRKTVHEHEQKTVASSLLPQSANLPTASGCCWDLSACQPTYHARFPIVVEEEVAAKQEQIHVIFDIETRTLQSVIFVVAQVNDSVSVGLMFARITQESRTSRNRNYVPTKSGSTVTMGPIDIIDHLCLRHQKKDSIQHFDKVAILWCSVLLRS
jgi:hypothetical protein